MSYEPGRPDVTTGLAEGLLERGRRAFDWLLPATCLSCVNRPAARHGLGLCAGCAGKVRVHSLARCHGCGQELRAATLPADHRCGECRRRPPPWSRLFTLWDYAPPADRILWALKFHRIEALAGSIAEQAWDRHAEQLAAAEVVIPVPVPWPRRLVRGFNQSEALARPLAGRLGRPLAAPLWRRPAGALARGRREERRRAARASFRLRRGARVPARVLLVDDVLTTGATLDVSSRLLRRAGAREVLALTPFWTPPTPPPGTPPRPTG